MGCVGRSPVKVDELVEHWTVLEDEQQLVAGKRGATRLGFALLLKFYARSGRFPRGRSELSQEAVNFVALQMKVPAGDLGFLRVVGQHDRVSPRPDPPAPGLPGVRRHRCGEVDGVAGGARHPGRTPPRSGARGAAGPVPRRAGGATGGGQG